MVRLRFWIFLNTPCKAAWVYDFTAKQGITAVCMSDSQAMEPFLPTGIQLPLDFDAVSGVFVSHFTTIKEMVP